MASGETIRSLIGHQSLMVSAAFAPSPAYNAAINGALSSQHVRFNALDIQSTAASPRELAAELRRMRDQERLFSGDIGLYNSFVHVDTRGHNTTWEAFRSGNEQVTRSPDERRQAVEATALIRTRSQMPKVRSVFQTAPAVPGGVADIEVALEQQKLVAAVAASRVVSFVSNLTPLAGRRKALAGEGPLAGRGWRAGRHAGGAVLRVVPATDLR